MDAQVLAAMHKWPDVAAVFGWLRLDARGQWWLRDDRLEHTAMHAFFARNYARDPQGRYYVQNGPQRVYVELETAPYVARRVDGGWDVSPGGGIVRAQQAFVTPDGEMLLEIDGGLALVDDRDLGRVVTEMLPAWDGMLATIPAQLPLPEGAIPLMVDTLVRLWRHYAVDLAPCD